MKYVFFFKSIQNDIKFTNIRLVNKYIFSKFI